jgi:Fe-S-cluster containining protein
MELTETHLLPSPRRRGAGGEVSANPITMNPTLHQRILEIYSEVDREVSEAGPKCDSSGRCCRFKEYGHTLFLSQLEADVLIANAPSFSQPVTNEYCPFQKENLCTAREPRPLGCRIYFCDPSYQERSHQITEKYLSILKSICEEFSLPWKYAPLHVFLNEAQINKESKSSMEQVEEFRISLPVIPT